MLPFSTAWYFVLSSVLFGIGLFGVVTQKSGIRLLMAIEILLNAANINFVAFGAFYGAPAGFVYALFVIAIAAAEATVGLAIFVNLFRVRKTIELDQINTLQG
jgi:F420H2 dehydrogenase subunit K